MPESAVDAAGELAIRTDPYIVDLANQALARDVSGRVVLASSSLSPLWCILHLAWAGCLNEESFHALVKDVRSRHCPPTTLVNEPARHAASGSAYKLACAPPQLFATAHPGVCCSLRLLACEARSQVG